MSPTQQPLVETNEKTAADSDDEPLHIEMVGVHLFPLTSKSQSDYVFNLIGREQVKDRDVFHLEFRRNRRVNTAGKGMPISMRAPTSRWLNEFTGAGFTVVYAPRPDGLWFPVSFGTELKIHVSIHLYP